MYVHMFFMCAGGIVMMYVKQVYYVCTCVLYVRYLRMLCEYDMDACVYDMLCMQVFCAMNDMQVRCVCMACMLCMHIIRVFALFQVLYECIIMYYMYA